MHHPTTTKRGLHLIEAPSNLGLKAPAPGRHPTVNQLPAWLKRWGFYERLAPERVHTVPAPPYEGHLDPASGVRNTAAIAAYSQQLAACVAARVRQPVFALVLGGDCSILLGAMLGLRQVGNYGLFFLDGHTDYAWPGLSTTGGAAGMDLALVTGRGPAQLANLNGLGPYVGPEHVWSVGNRDEDPAYVAAIEASPIHYVDLRAARRQGLRACATAFLRHVEAAQLDGFWVHLDVDVLDHDLMPAVDSPQPGGLTYAELQEVLAPLVASPGATGLNLTILDPQLDPTGAATRGFIQGVQPLLIELNR
jgi:arginase